MRGVDDDRQCNIDHLPCVIPFLAMLTPLHPLRSHVSRPLQQNHTRVHCVATCQLMLIVELSAASSADPDHSRPDALIPLQRISWLSFWKLIPAMRHPHHTHCFVEAMVASHASLATFPHSCPSHLHPLVPSTMSLASSPVGSDDDNPDKPNTSDKASGVGCTFR
jgi:hypothetical protein